MENEVLAALIGIGGVLLGGTVQWLVARSTIRSETERLHRQLSTEFRLQQFSEWQMEFRGVVSELLALTDPEAQNELKKDRAIPLVLKAQLMLNPRVPTHARVNEAINQLALAVNGWHGPQNAATILRIHAELLDAARETIFLPGS